MSRRRYVYNDETKQVEEVSPDWTDTPRRAPVPTEQIVFGNLTATDGTDISSRKKHREYMKSNGLALTGDFKETWERAAKERERAFTPGAGYDKQARTMAIVRAYEQLRSKRR